jgi:hypothetical protein
VTVKLRVINSRLAMHTEVTGSVEVTHTVLAVPGGTREHERMFEKCSPAFPESDSMTL